MLAGRVALVTGATRGIGWATARALAAAGAAIVLNGRSSREQLEARVAELRAEHGVPCSGALGDVSDAAVVKGWYQEIFRTHRRLDVLVNNAGVLEDALVGMIPEASIAHTLAVNVAGALHNLQGAARLMARGGGGSIVNVSSIIGTHGNAGQTLYAASKAALLGMTRAAAKELAPSQVRVNAVAPGFIDTDMTRALPRKAYDERLAAIGMGRIGTPDDVARVVLFLASDLSGYVTGQVIGVDGGMLV
jgi:3-oxoacyl-[acyl-carrier protein] reductase